MRNHRGTFYTLFRGLLNPAISGLIHPITTISEVLQHRHGGHGGPERRLTPEQEAELKAKAVRGEIRTIHDAVTWAKQVHGVDYSYWGMRWVFDRLALKKKVPRPKSPQASAQAQEAWKKGS